MEVNKIHNINFLDNTLPDKCANLIIADPPYFEVKGDFDFIWKSFNDYLLDVEKWAVECKRLLADNGTLFWYGDRKKIAYTQIILDKYFNLENTLCWQKSKALMVEMFDLRTFPERLFERILMYSSKNERNTFAEYLQNIVNEYGIKSKDIQILFPSKTGGLTGCVTNWLKGYNIMTNDQYQLLQKNIPEFNRTYADLVNEYNLNRRYFKNDLNLTDLLEFTQGNADYTLHDTPKPEKLTRALILTCSRKDDLVVVPFAGSGTECAMSVKEGRKTIGFEITEKHAKMSNDRVQNILRQPSLFVGS
jgi:site-specific DNA-methyltransferase (adenine-specific)